MTGLLLDPEMVDSGTRIVALDRAPLIVDQFVPTDLSEADRTTLVERLEVRQADLLAVDPAPLLSNARTVVHLADERSGRGRPVTVELIEAVRTAAANCGVGHLVVLSSAMVYGAREDNPVPIPESQPLQPEPGLDYAMAKAEVEAGCRRWSRDTGIPLAVIRPAAAFSEGSSSWIGLALRAALAVRPEQVDPPVQFVHDQDLADAITLAVVRRLDSTYNVAADGWIGADAFRALRGESEVRMPERIGRMRMRAAKALADESLLAGLEPYIRHPWVVATDKIRAEGWNPTYSNEESYMAGTPPPLLSSVGPQRRQELALGAASAAGAAVVGASVWAARRLGR